MRKLSILISLLGLVGMCVAQQASSGTMEVAFGWVKQPDGTRKSIKGLKIPYFARQVQAARVTRNGTVVGGFPGLSIQSPGIPGFGARGYAPGGKGGGTNSANLLVYAAWNANGTGYAIIDPAEFVDPSSLDDITITSSGSGKIWTQLDFGIHNEGASGHTILVRWRIWNTHISAPTGANDYTDELADFGALVAPNAGTWLYTASGAAMSQAGVIVPDTDCYIAQQFRDTSDLVNGNGPFELNYYNVYYTAAPPSPGSSTDGWIYDSDPLDGIYEDTEFDAFTTDPPPPYSNMAHQIFVNSSTTTTTSYPTTVTPVVGRSEYGNNISLWFANDLDEYQLVSKPIDNRTLPWAETDIETVSPGTALLALRVQTRTMVTRPNVTQKIELWRYGGGTPQWVPFDSRVMPMNQYVDVDAVYGGTVPLSQFVGTGNKLKLRLTYFPGPGSQKFVTMQDKVNWVLTR